MARRQPARDVIVKLIVGAGQASPSPPVGPALGSKGVKSMDFCKVILLHIHPQLQPSNYRSQEFNALTAHINPGTPIPALVTVRPDRSFHFQLRTPPTATLLLTAAGVNKGKGGKLRGANAVGRTPATTSASPSAILTASAGGKPGKSMMKSVGGGVGEGTAVMVAKTAGGDKELGNGGGSTQVGEVSLKHVFEIAKIKQTEPRLSGMELEGLVRSVVAQARSIGVGVVP